MQNILLKIYLSNGSKLKWICKAIHSPDILETACFLSVNVPSSGNLCEGSLLLHGGILHSTKGGRWVWWGHSERVHSVHGSTTVCCEEQLGCVHIFPALPFYAAVVLASLLLKRHRMVRLEILFLSPAVFVDISLHAQFTLWFVWGLFNEVYGRQLLTSLGFGLGLICSLSRVCPIVTVF